MNNGVKTIKEMHVSNNLDIQFADAWIFDTKHIGCIECFIFGYTSNIQLWGSKQKFVRSNPEWKKSHVFYMWSLVFHVCDTW